MHFKRILFTFSLVITTTSAAFADLIQLDRTTQQASSPDRLELLTKTLAQGAYIEPQQEEQTANTQMSVKLRDTHVEFNNETIEKKYGSSIQIAANKSSYAGSNLSSWLISHPLPSGRVSSNYGGRTMGGRAENHSGLDLAAPTGTPIYATGPGIVTKSGWGTGYGQYVEINHGNGYLTRYAHASRLIAKVGDRVQAGEHIANVGCTGRCTGPHLHYEVVKDGQRKNPSTYLAMLP